MDRILDSAPVQVVFTFITTLSELRKVLFLYRQSVVFLFAYEISWEPHIRFVPNSAGKMCLVPRSDEFEGQGHQGQNCIFWPFWRPACSLCLVKHL